ncbi:MAG: UDP-N-acetylglucosamine 1-carboxyvinyltransferase [SAR86 cluster bacterium]|jgi:UDP-N-acetylglucosamine 1-carboxyvinyltransferase|nr:UDP-N-acetylglucosamine 1-carboxyvinyltransferase [Gammaproteobacteria bacterium]MDG0966068.1 UDP-N-acetylglucosamine 1-carboxyvinyltransferase [SAR86 cluster bacterium]MDG2347009.1 UDP-N-acetylglucosamine 1-carboxyvinyltransferase [SAR86 cluster bacterium]
MEKLKIIGGNKLSGTISCSGAKNAALPMLAATILCDKPITFKNLPYLQDITTMFELLGSMGADITLNESMDFIISTSNLHDFEARYELVKTMRASILVLGSLVARHGFARIALPGGCAIGTRPVDFHLDALEKLGAKIELKNGYIEASSKKLVGCEINFPGISVTGTENIMMAAVLAKGQTVLRNVAKEPEVEDLADFLNSMGAKISGAGTDEIIIEGVEDLQSSVFSIPADRIEAGTYLIAAAVTFGDITISDIQPSRMNNILDKLKLSGASINASDNEIQLIMDKKSILPVDISTAPFPGFPTDMQAQFTVLNALSNGSSVVTENVFENRFMHVQELNRMGCDITVKGSNALVKGVTALNGAPVMATDLRASASLILAGLCAEGETIVDRIYHIDRGYERIEEKLSYLGADITRLPN